MVLRKLFIGNIFYSPSLNVIKHIYGFIAVENGKIAAIGDISELENFQKQEDDFKNVAPVELSSSQFLIPGFIDCHVHAPQFPNIGLGLDRPLLEWLSKYTFPLEKKYVDTQFAIQVYDTVVRRLLRNGTTTACYFGSLHLVASVELANAAMRGPQRALVGKVSMNVANDAGYYNSTEKELSDTEEFIKIVKSFVNDLVEPIITPRFAISCDSKLMTELAVLSNKYKCKIQSHISENQGEVAAVSEMFPHRENYTDVYDKAGLMTNRSIMAHGIWLSDDEMSVFECRGTSVAHCPASNTRLQSGLCPVRALINKGVTVGLGSDVSGGDSSSMLEAIRRTMDVSVHRKLVGNEETPTISWMEAFYLATLGGAKALNLDSKVGSFEVGKEFDALLVDTYALGSGLDRYPQTDVEHEDALALLQRFIYLGDDRNILIVYVKGREVFCE